MNLGESENICVTEPFCMEEVFKKRFLRVGVVVGDQFRLVSRRDHYTDQLIYELEGYIWGQEAERVEVRVDYPLDWWQAFKERWFPVFLIRRFPVKRKKIRKALVAEVLYPDLNIVEPNRPYVVKVFKEDASMQP